MDPTPAYRIEHRELKLNYPLLLLFANATGACLGRRNCNHNQIRTFLNARIKWVRDPYLDSVVEREKNLKPLLDLKNLILSQPSKALSLSAISPLKPILRLPTIAEKFIRNYPFFFRIFLPPGKSNPLRHVKVVHRALSLHQDEVLILGMSHYRHDAANRLAKFLMLAGAGKAPLWLIDMFKYDLGLPHDYMLTLPLEFADYFQICEMGVKESSGEVVFGLELVSWRKDLAISEMERRRDVESGMKVRYSMKFSSGFDLEKKVQEWVDGWQNLPYISPYENAFHLAPNSDLTEKWVVAVIHELLSLLVWKKTERNNLFQFAESLRFGSLMFKRALVHFPGIFYVSNKLKTQTVVLREAYIKNLPIEKHPLMVMRSKYISLMNLVLRRGKPFGSKLMGRRKQAAASRKGRKMKVDVDHNRLNRSEGEDE